MILSNVSIHKALDNKWLVIDPEPSPRWADGTAECPFQTTATDLRLANEIAYFKEGLPISIDLRGEVLRICLARIRGPTN